MQTAKIAHYTWVDKTDATAETNPVIGTTHYNKSNTTTAIDKYVEAKSQNGDLHAAMVEDNIVLNGGMEESWASAPEVVALRTLLVRP